MLLLLGMYRLMHCQQYCLYTSLLKAHTEQPGSYLQAATACYSPPLLEPVAGAPLLLPPQQQQQQDREYGALVVCQEG